MFMPGVKIAEHEAVPGDHLYRCWFGGIGAHCGIFIGDNKVIHYVGNDTSLRSWCRKCEDDGSKGRNEVIQTCLQCFRKGYSLGRFRYGERNALRAGYLPYEADDATTVIRRAKEKLRKGFKLFSRSISRLLTAEQFCIYCKTRVRPGNKIATRELLPGDHIFCYRKPTFVYSHHGIFIGDNKVIHFVGNKSGSEGTWCDDCRGLIENDGLIRNRDGLILSCVKCFRKGHRLRLVSYGIDTVTYYGKMPGTCSKDEADDPAVVIQRANAQLQQPMLGPGMYNLFTNNCEAFCHFCKTGRSTSHQISKLARYSFNYAARALIPRHGEHASDGENSDHDA